MSRAINLSAARDHVLATCAKRKIGIRDHVLATCAKRKIGISAIETLQSGGTRVVMNNADDTAILAKIYGRKVIAGGVLRVPTRMGRL